MRITKSQRDHFRAVKLCATQYPEAFLVLYDWTLQLEFDMERR